MKWFLCLIAALLASETFAAGPDHPMTDPYSSRSYDVSSGQYNYYDSSSGARTPAASNMSQGNSGRKVLDEKVSPERVYMFGKQEHSIIVTPNGFFPSMVKVRRNVPVHINLIAENNHKLCFMMPAFSVKAGVESKMKRFEFRPEKTGPIEFHCPINGKKGKIIVVD